MGTSVLDVVKTIGPALVALAGVWLGSGLTRGRERRAWRRSQLVGACSDFVKATSAVAQWATSDQFAARLGAGQYPTDYKEDLAGLEAAVAALSISTPSSISSASVQASAHVRAFVDANAKHQGDKPKGDAMDAAGYQTDLAAWYEDHDAVDTARSKWTAAHAEFINAARRELDTLS
ncbi:MAG: hypothetical protein ACRDSH_14970 [Pseudonocardiaceae bacterium]